jgi:hypothetical protein
MMIVLVVVASAAVLSWAMLSASSMRARVNVNAVDSIQGNYLAESGVNLALHYLRYPDLSPVTRVTGASGNLHYPGQSNLTLWTGAPGTVTITVTNPESNKFKIISTSSISNPQGGTQTRRIMAEAMLQLDGYKVSNALTVNDDFFVVRSMSINGPVLADGSITRDTTGANINGVVKATNGSSFPDGINTTVNSPAPAHTALRLVAETATRPPGATTNQRAYTYNGQQYLAERIPTTMTGTLGPTTTNPAGVYWSENARTIQNLNLNGTLVFRSDSLMPVLRGSVNITPLPGMPALIAGDVDIQSSSASPANVNLRGLVIVKDRIRNTTAPSSPATTVGSITIDGALMFTGSSPKVDDNVRQNLSLNWSPGRLSVPTLLSGGGETVVGIRLMCWQED